MLCREVLHLRGAISREVPWKDTVMVDLFFYRDPEEVSFIYIFICKTNSIGNYKFLFHLHTWTVWTRVSCSSNSIHIKCCIFQAEKEEQAAVEPVKAANVEYSDYTQGEAVFAQPEVAEVGSRIRVLCTIVLYLIHSYF